MARKQAVKAEPQAERVVSFRAPDRVHGALKQIVGRLEMMQNEVGGRVPYERDVLAWLVGELFMEGPANWATRIEKSHKQYQEFMSQN